MLIPCRIIQLPSLPHPKAPFLAVFALMSSCAQNPIAAWATLGELNFAPSGFQKNNIGPQIRDFVWRRHQKHRQTHDSGQQRSAHGCADRSPFPVE